MKKIYVQETSYDIYLPLTASCSDIKAAIIETLDRFEEEEGKLSFINICYLTKQICISTRWKKEND